MNTFKELKNAVRVQINKDFKSEIDILKQDLACSQFLNISMIQVKGLFQRVNPKKSPGPDNIGGMVLRTCAEQLCEIFHYIFSQSLMLQRVPEIWKKIYYSPCS